MVSVELSLVVEYLSCISVLRIQRRWNLAKDGKTVHDLSAGASSYLAPFLKTLARNHVSTKQNLCWDHPVELTLKN
jgi:hypothetical protein